MAVRSLKPGQRSRIHLFDVETNESTLVHESREVLYEAPNWTHDDRLIVNADGALFALAAAPGATPVPIVIDDVAPLNNDHVLAPDGEHIYISTHDRQLYRVALEGGSATLITDPDDGVMHFLHGVSPDGSTLAYIGLIVDDGRLLGANVYTIGVDGTGNRLIYDGGVADGSDFSPDGEWIYFNTEQFGSAPGHAQIARVRIDGSGLEQLTADDRVNWFPHLAPVGDLAVYLSYPAGTTGHPADLRVQLRLVRGGDWSAPEVAVELDGGQGTLNVPSWSPDGRRFAYVDYPFD